MTTYQTAKDNLFATGTIENGYFGDRVSVGFYFDRASGKTLAVADCGWFTYHTPMAVDEDEAYYLLQVHPTSRADCLTRLDKR